MADVDDDRWSVRGVSRSARDAAMAAARRADVSIGTWLSTAIDAAVRAEREPLDGAQGEVLTDAVADRVGERFAGFDMVERAVSAAVALAGAPDVPTAFRRRANRLLREALPAPVPRATPAKPRLLAGVGVSADD